MSRRSQRLRSRGLPESNAYQVISEEPEVISTPKLKAATVRKRARRSTKSSRTQRTEKQIVDMPLEVILEICGHLLPKDLLNLSRTSKSFRSLLMSRRSKSIWKMVCSNLPGLPPCPHDLTEPAYINLMFDAHCHSCLKKNCDRVYLLWKARLCEYCRNNPDIIVKITSEFQLQFSQILGSPSHTIFDVLPVDYNLLYKPQVDAFVKLLNRTPAEDRAGLLNARQKFISNMGRYAQHNRLLAKWRESEKVARQEELNRRRKERQEAILEKLKEEGWKEEVDYMDQIPSEWEQIKLLPHLRTSQALTPRIWTNIKRDLTTYMRKLRNKRIVETRRWTVEERLMQLYNFLRNPEGPRAFPATPREVALFVPEVYRSITPDEPNFNVEGLHAPIKDYLEMRSQKARELLRDLIIRECNVDESRDPFSLAVGSLFVCLDCRFRDALSLERAMDHCCDRHRTVKRPRGMSVEIYDYIDAGASTTGTSVWRGDWYHRSISTLSGVVKACGLDPGVATTQDLDRADVRLRCASHDHQSSDPRPIMTWRTAAIYSARQQPCKVFERATEAEAAAAKPLEAAALRAWVEWWESAGEYRCNHCRPWSQPWNYRGSGMSKHKVITHIQNSHEIAEPTESDWTDDHDTIQIPNPVYLVSEKLRHTPRRRDTCQDQELDHLLNAGLATYFEFE